MFPIKISFSDIKETVKSLRTKEGRIEFYNAHKEIIMYFVFGVGTTIISFGTYYLTRLLFPNEDSVPRWLAWIFNITAAVGIESNTALPVLVSWICSVTFAFLTNRIYVFHSKADTVGKFLIEGAKFYATRIATLIFDMVVMFLLVDLTGIHNAIYEFCAKIFSNIMVLILNYILSRLFVFKQKKKKPEDSSSDNEEGRSAH